MVTPCSQCGARAPWRVLVGDNFKQDRSCWAHAWAMAPLCHCNMLMWHDLLACSYNLMWLESVVSEWFPGHGTIQGCPSGLKMMVIHPDRRSPSRDINCLQKLVLLIDCGSRWQSSSLLSFSCEHSLVMFTVSLKDLRGEFYHKPLHRETLGNSFPGVIIDVSILKQML